MFAIITVILIAFVGGLKVFWEKPKKAFEIILIFLAFLTAIFNIWQESDKDSKSKARLLADSIRHNSEIKEAKNENVKLQSKLDSLNSDNHTLINSVSSFKETFKKTAKRQDSITNYMTGGENLPIISANIFSKIEPQSMSSTLTVFLDNRGLVPLWNIHYRLTNPITKEVIERDIAMMTFQYGRPILEVPLPKTIDSLYFDCNVIWAGLHLRTYTTQFWIHQKNGMPPTIATKYVYASGERYMEEFNPLLSKAIHMQKPKIGKSIIKK